MTRTPFAALLAFLLVAPLAEGAEATRPGTSGARARPATGVVRVLVIATDWGDIGYRKSVRVLAGHPVRLLDARGRVRQAETDKAGCVVFHGVTTGRTVARCLVPGSDPKDAAGWVADTFRVQAGRTALDTLRPPITNAKRLYR